jgi:hypothetical protein
MKTYDAVESVAKQCNLEVSIYPSPSGESVVVTMMSGETVPSVFDDAAKAANLRVSYSSGECVVSQA